jgi:hypothetical protein
MSLQHSPRIITDGLVLCLDAANRQSYPGSGTVWTDLAGSNNGTLTNGPTFSSANGGSLVFDGSNDYINLQNPSALNLTELTVSAWVRTTTNANQIILGKSYLTSYYLNIAPNVKVFSFWTTGSSLNSPVIQEIGGSAWCHVAGTINNTTKRIYFNGISVNSAAGATVGIDSNSVFIGSWYNLSAFFNGNISQVSIYNRALTPVEILQNYNATKGRYNL